MSRRGWTAPLEVEDHGERQVVWGDGRKTRDVNVVMTEDQYREMAAGYRCCRCYGMVESAFPETCGLPGCDGYPNGFPMRERQAEVLRAEFDGYTQLGISQESYERMKEHDEMVARAAKSGIHVPGR